MLPPKKRPRTTAPPTSVPSTAPPTTVPPTTAPATGLGGSASLLTVPTVPPPPVPERVTQGGTVWGPVSGGKSLLDVAPVKEKGITHPFEPTVGPVGNFAQKRKFEVPKGRTGVILQHIRRDFDVEDHSVAPRRKATMPEVDALASGGGGEASATHGSYLEAFPVVTGTSGRRKPLVDTFGMTGIAPHAKRALYEGGDARALDDTTSGSVTISGDARFYEHSDPMTFIGGLGFAPQVGTPANGLHERPLGVHGTHPRIDSLDDVDALRPHSGRVDHSVRSTWDTSDPAKVESSLTLNGTPWIEPP